MLRTAVMALLLAASPALAQEAPADLPDTPVAGVFRSWIRAVNARDSSLAHEHAVRYEADPNDPVGVLRSTLRVLSVGRQSGGLSVERWQASGPDTLDVTLRDSRGVRLALHLVVERIGETWRVGDFTLRLAAPPPDQQQELQRAEPRAADRGRSGHQPRPSRDALVQQRPVTALAGR